MGFTLDRRKTFAESLQRQQFVTFMTTSGLQTGEVYPAPYAGRVKGDGMISGSLELIHQEPHFSSQYAGDS
jgi:hypothetical protein